MIYKVINGDVHVGSVNIVNLASAASLFIGDCQSVILTSISETPPESYIVGVEQPAETPEPTP
ncbi:spore gernimation protein [Brevibacillus choshinensis]|uniref:Spore gernimation protein n=1 Tax=Brevibacillus choshinensis TaxID=54911 RepID=A0ABX7FHQ4_BRECH|nr:spore gernimation protein [Brevibacillus choshinensis]QRG65734.1 spore gernimation protein [Brevibacillus choshinensis]